MPQTCVGLEVLGVLGECVASKVTQEEGCGRFSLQKWRLSLSLKVGVV